MPSKALALCFLIIFGTASEIQARRTAPRAVRTYTLRLDISTFGASCDAWKSAAKRGYRRTAAQLSNRPVRKVRARCTTWSPRDPDDGNMLISLRIRQRTSFAAMDALEEKLDRDITRGVFASTLASNGVSGYIPIDDEISCIVGVQPCRFN